MSTEVARAQEATDFLRALFEHRSHPTTTFVQLWHKVNKTSHYFTDLGEAALTAVKLKSDVYVCAGLSPKKYGPSKRALKTQIVGIPGLWVDVDVNGGPENKEHAAPTLDDAHEFIMSILQPTLLVHSGYGLQAWYLFEEPWVFADVQEQQRAAEMSLGFTARFKQEAAKRDWKIDATQDLSRLMRVPGTFNGKGGLSAPVSGYGEPVSEQDGPRYALEVLSEHVVSVTIKSEPTVTGVDVDFNAQPPADKLSAMLENSDTFKQSWNKDRHDDASKNWSASEWDLSIASMASYGGWEDQEIANLLIAYRRKHGEDLKNPQYYEKTIARAKKRREVDSEREQRAQERAEAIDTLEQVVQAEGLPVDPNHVCAAFSKVIGGPPVKELVQSNRDPRTAVLRLVLADGDEVSLGGMRMLSNQDYFRDIFATVTGHMPPAIKKPDWISACNALLRTRQVREVELTTMESEVRSWLRDYLQLLTPDHNEAATRRDPFQKEDELWVAPRAFADYVSRHLRRRTTVAELEETLTNIGFVPKVKTYVDVDRDKRTSTKDYYCAPISLIQEGE